MLSLWYQATVLGTGPAPLAVEGKDIMHSFFQCTEIQLVVQIKRKYTVWCYLIHLLLTLPWLTKLFSCCLQTSPEGDDEEVFESCRPWEARVWPVIQWPPGSCVTTHCTAKLGPRPSTHGPWSVQLTRPLQLRPPDLIFSGVKFTATISISLFLMIMCGFDFFFFYFFPPFFKN